jgi:hypothetical protein
MRMLLGGTDMAETAPGGGPVPLGPVSTKLTYQAQLEQYAAGFDGTLGSAYGPEFITFAAQHPLLSAKQAATAFADGVAAQSVGHTIASGVGAVAQANAIIGSGVASGAVAVNPTNLPNPLSGLEAIGHFFAMLTERQTLQRIAEGMLGLVLIVVAVAKLAEGTKTGQMAKSVATKVGVKVV